MDGFFEVTTGAHHDNFMSYNKRIIKTKLTGLLEEYLGCFTAKNRVQRSKGQCLNDSRGTIGVQ